jgi:putative peptide zinc metalloprotease protein
MQITLKSILKLHLVDIRKDKKYFIVHDLVTTDFFEMTEVCVVAINKIKDGYVLGDIEKELILQFPQEEIDLLEFAEQLVELGMVEEIDGNLVEAVDRKKEELGFTRISPKLGMLFFNNPMKLGYIFLFLINISLFIIYPHLFPHYKDVFIFGYMFQNILVWIVIGGILVLIHEMGHIFAIRGYGQPTKIEIGHRLFMVVLETDLSLGWKLPLKERISLYLSGLCFDNIILFFALIAQILLPGSSGIFQSIMAFVVLDVVIRFIYQCCVYMKTDLYYVLENLTGCHNLMENAKGIIFKRKQQLTIFEGEKRTIYLYSVFYLLGLILSVILFVFYYIPQIVYVFLKIAPGLKAPMNSVLFLDAVFVLLQILLVIGLLSYSWSKTLRKPRKQFE